MESEFVGQRRGIENRLLKVKGLGKEGEGYRVED